MAATKPKQERLPGTGAPAAAVERYERINAALTELHDAMSESIEGLPEQSSLTFRKRIKGDYIQVTLQPGKAN